MNRTPKFCETIAAYIRKLFANNELEGIRLTLFGGSTRDCICYLRSRSRNP